MLKRLVAKSSSTPDTPNVQRKVTKQKIQPDSSDVDREQSKRRKLDFFHSAHEALNQSNVSDELNIL